MFETWRAILFLLTLAWCHGEIIDAGTTRWAEPESLQKTIPNSESPWFSSSWLVLGPFQIGTREAAWGADPLEYHGGFPNLKYNASEKYKSSLGINGSVTWSSIEASEIQITTTSPSAPFTQISLSLSFPTINWPFLQSIYGWSATQHQAWLRGSIVVPGDIPETLLLSTDRILENAIDGSRSWGGDFYAYGRAPHVVTLAPGRHVLDVRVVRDVRAMGGMGADVTVRLALGRPRGELEIVEGGMVVADVVDGTLVGVDASIPLRNSGGEWLRIEAVEVLEGDVHRIDTHPFLLAPGQTRPYTFQLTLPRNQRIPSVHITVTYSLSHSNAPLSTISATLPLRHRSLHSPQKLTFLHPSGIVSYAVLRPPASTAPCSNATGFRAPVLLALHGAGVDADSDQETHSLDGVGDLCAWIVFPSGVTSWSGDDWHNWGFADVQAAVDAIPGWIKRVGWMGVGVDTESWIVSGHSNGGQGAWYILTHHPDKVLSAAPVSGYLSIPQYVPAHFWHPADPSLLSVLQSSLTTYRHELLAPNANGIPILQQHGRVDDNVPVYHSRLMSQLLAEAGWESRYVELPDKGHWFDGVMTTRPLRDFYHASLSLEKPAMALSEYRVVSADPGGTGGKQGVRIRRLEEPGRMGWVDVVVEQIDADTCFLSLKTRNVIEIGVQYYACIVVGLRVDGFEIGADISPRSLEASIVRGHDGTWMTSSHPVIHNAHRAMTQMGGFDAILRTKGPFTITYTTPTLTIAQQIARNMYQYFAADSHLTDHHPSAFSHAPGNAIITTLSRSALPGLDPQAPISISDDGLRLRRASGDEVIPFDEVRGAVWVAPLARERLALVVWGVDDAGLLAASRLVPVLTGTGSPDFVVLGRKMGWEGVAGVRAVGFWDEEWRVAERSSYV